MFRRYKVAFFAAALLRIPLCGQTTPKALRIPRVVDPPKLEDYLNGGSRDKEALVQGFRQREPGDGAPVSQETSAYLSYDDKNLYVIFVCHDEPGKTRAHMVKREDIGGDDQIGIYLDTFHDRQRAYFFEANPHGIQRDSIFSEGEKKPDYSFDTLWYSQGKVTANGFVVWMAIPFKSLRFSNTPVQEWGIALTRSIVRNNEDSYWPYVTGRVQGLVQQLATLNGIEQVARGRNIQFIPYGLFGRSNVFNGDLPGYRTSYEKRGGMDTKVVLRDAFTLDVTLNPDFSQVESDEPQVTVNQRYEVFFPEKRPFFIENAGFFQTPINLFFSRRIIDPEYGARLTGKAGRWAIGALAIDDRAPGRKYDPGDPRFGDRAHIEAFRAKREFGEQSSIGVLATERGFGSGWNRVISLDTRLKLTPNWTFTGQAIQSYERNLDGTHLSGPAYYAELTRSGRHFTHSTNYSDRSPNFRSDLGFIQRVDIRQGEEYASYLWRPNGKRLVSFGPTVSALVNYNRLGQIQDWLAGGTFDIAWNGPTQVSLSRYETFELYLGQRFRKARSGFSFFTGWLKWLEMYGSYGQGSEINYSPASGLLPFLGNSENGSFGATFKLPRLRLEESYLYSRLGARSDSPVEGSPAIFNNHIFRSKVNYQFSRALSLRTILDYYAVLPNPSLVKQDRFKQLTPDFLLTYLVNPYTALYFGYTERYQNFGFDAAGQPLYNLSRAPTTLSSRQLFIKISYLLRR